VAEPKPFASLSSGLLARKGAARPAMRPQGFGQMGAGLEDLGWNDMGFEPPKPTLTPAPDVDHDAFGEVAPAHPHNLGGLTPVESPVHKQQAELTGRLSSYSPEDAGEDEEEFDETAELYDTSEADEVRPAFESTKVYETEEPEAEEAESETLELRTVIESIATIAPPAAVETARATAPRRPRKPRAASGSKDKAAFTLRLDSDRHLKLRLACAIGGRSAQMLVTEALDRLLASMPELEAMAEKAKRKG
jgi:hypothetical protein